MGRVPALAQAAAVCEQAVDGREIVGQVDAAVAVALRKMVHHQIRQCPGLPGMMHCISMRGANLSEPGYQQRHEQRGN